MVVRWIALAMIAVLGGCAGDGDLVQVPINETQVIELGVNEYTGAMGSAIFVTVPGPAGGYAVHVLHGGGLMPLAAWSGTQLGSAALLADGLRHSGSSTMTETNIEAKTKTNTNVGVGVDVTTGRGKY